jgi:hypothetical protein
VPVVRAGDGQAAGDGIDIGHGRLSMGGWRHFTRCGGAVAIQQSPDEA